jgi:hypothetical protein
MPQPKSHQGTDEITCQNPQIPSAVEVHDVLIVKATDASLKGYDCLVDDQSAGIDSSPQNKVHARISVRWTEEFNKVLRVPLSLPL